MDSTTITFRSNRKQDKIELPILTKPKPMK